MKYTIITLLTLMILSFCFAYMIAESIKKSIYSYSNILLITGFIASVSLFLMVLVTWIIALNQFKEVDLYSLVFVEFPKTMLVISIPISIIIFGLISISNIALIRHEGFRVKNLLGFIQGIVYIGLAITFGILLNLGDNAYLECLNIFIMLLVCYAEWVYFAFLIISYIAVKHKITYDKDYILILGCLISKSGGLLPLLKERTNAAMKFAWKQEVNTGKALRFVPTGGQGPDEIMAEGSAIEMYLLSHSAEENEVFAEKKSKNTRENFTLSKKLIEEHTNEKYKIAFATTNYHIFRAGIYARMAGFENPQGVASPTKWYFWPNGLLREFVAIINMNRKSHILYGAFISMLCIILLIVNLLLC